MAGGLLLLAAYGKENLVLSYNPEITFFKVIYRRHTNFAIEPMEQPFKNTPNFGTRVSSHISQNGDLISNIYVVVDLPSIFPPTRTDISNSIKKFAWVKKLGWALIRSVELIIDGILIDRHLGEWLNIWAELKITSEHKRGLDKMIGNIEELYNYSSGKQTYRLHIPLSFWFCDYFSTSLPLIALLHNDIQVNVDFNEFKLCHNVTPTHYITINENFVLFKEGEILVQTLDNTTAKAEFIYFDVLTNKMYVNYISGTFISTIVTTNSIVGVESNFIVTPKNNLEGGNLLIKDQDYFRGFSPSIENAFLVVNYVYLDHAERLKFITSNHEYLIQTVQFISDLPVFSHFNKIKLTFVNPCIEIIWRLVLNSNKIQNDFFNYQTERGTNIVTDAALLIDGLNRVNVYSGEYYSDVQNYLYHTNTSSPGLNIYSFSLHPQQYQPSGSLNFSKVKDVTLELNLDKTVTYQNNAFIQVFARSYNVLRIIDKRAALAYSS
jgi:hypothetical protein